MSQRDDVIIEGPEPPVEALAALLPREPVPRDLDRAVLQDIQGRLRAERRGPSWRRTALVAAVSALGAAAAAVAVMWFVQPPAESAAGLTPRGTGDEAPAGVHLDFLVQHPDAEAPARLEADDRLRVGDAVYLRAELDRAGMLTFLVEPPGEAWEPLTTLPGVAGANDLRRDGRLQVFYVTEAGPHRFAAVYSQAAPPEDWKPGGETLPHITLLGEGAEVAWVEVEATVKDASR